MWQTEECAQKIKTWAWLFRSASHCGATSPCCQRHVRKTCADVHPGSVISYRRVRGPEVPLSRLASRTKTIAYEQSRVQRTKVENVETEALATRLASSSQSIVASSFTLLEKLFHNSPSDRTLAGRGLPSYSNDSTPQTAASIGRLGVAVRTLYTRRFDPGWQRPVLIWRINRVAV